MHDGVSLSSSTALVTGASSGIGAEFARALHERGIGQLVLVARRRDRLEALASEIGPHARVIVADLTRPEDVERLVAAEPRIDLLVNNAGAGSSEMVEKTARDDPGRLTAMVDLNCRAMVRLTSSWVPEMAQRGYGWILNVGSIAGMFPTPTSAVYGATKAFVASFTESLRIELSGTGVRVLLLAPGPMATEFFGNDDELERRYRRFFVPPRRVVDEGLDGLFADRARLVPGATIKAAALLGSAVPLSLFRTIASSAMRRRRKRQP